MASLCTRCALRLHRAAAATDAAPATRTFTSSSTRRTHAIPQFSETTNSELNDVLATMRSKHFIPAALTPAQRRLIFGHSRREELTNYPQAIEIAGEKVDLKWIDRRTEIPNRTKLFRQAVQLMAEDGSAEAWGNLVALLVGLKRSGVEVSRMEMERLLRVAGDKGHFDAIIACLRRGDETAVTFKRPEVLEGVLLALKKKGTVGNAAQEDVERAIKYGRVVAQLLEMEMHGGGKQMKTNDLRRDPRVIGVFLELNAVFADKFQGGKDADGRVKAYAERLLYNLEQAREMPTSEPAQHGPQTDMLLGISIYHGLALAQKILAMDMPNAMLAQEVNGNYGRSLSAMAEKLEQQTPGRSPGSYADVALAAWKQASGV